MTEQCTVHRLGIMPYQHAWRLQERLAAEIAAGERPPTLLLLEHPHTYTFGRRGDRANLLWDEAELERRGISVHWVDRGGDVTYHGPGQLVGYPLLPLAPGGLKMSPSQVGAPFKENASSSLNIPRADYVGYLRKLEAMLIDALGKTGVESQRVEGLTGVWVGVERSMTYGETKEELAKIASIGVKVDVNGISRHGFALNVAPDMTYWKGIIACGLVDFSQTSMAKLLGVVPNMQRVMDRVVISFGEVLDFVMIEDSLD